VEEEGKVTISIALTMSPTDIGWQIIDKSIDKFMEENPDVYVKKILIGGNYRTKILIMVAGGIAPDIFRVVPDMVVTYISKGILMPLDEFVINSKVLKLEDFFPAVLHKYKFDGKTIGKGSIYGFGTDWSPDKTLFFNKTMFNEAGIEHPAKSLSWEEFRDIARKLTYRAGGKKQFGCLLSETDIPLLVYQNGGKVFSEDGKKCLLNSPEAVEAFQFLVDLKVKDKIMPSYSESESQKSNLLELFQTGTLGMLLSGRYYVPNIQKLVKNFEWGVAPGLHQKKRVNVVTGPCGWGMSKGVKNPQEVWKLMEWLVVGECEKDLAKAGYNIPVVKEIAYSELFLTNPDHPEGINKIFMDEVEYTIPSPVTPYIMTDRWRNIIGAELELAFLGKQSAEEAACNAAQRINAVIKTNLRK